jgi:hypothetical protein
MSIVSTPLRICWTVPLNGLLEICGCKKYVVERKVKLCLKV